jgi:hypothetical protein
MPFRIYAAILSSQLVVAVADRVPEFDVEPFCRAYSDQSYTNKDCLAAEKLAHEKLIAAWPQYTAQDKAMCVMEEKIAGRPSYVGWQTCLDINANARRVGAPKSADTNAPGAGAGASGEPVPKSSARVRRRKPRTE